MSVVLAEHEPLFELVERSVVRETLDLDRDALLELLTGTYRGVRHGVAERVAALTRMTVTLASEILVFASQMSPSSRTMSAFTSATAA